VSGLFTRLVARTLRVGPLLTPRLPTGLESWSGPAGFGEEAREIEAAAAPAARAGAPRGAPPGQPEGPGGKALAVAAPEMRSPRRAGEMMVVPGRSPGTGMRERTPPPAGIPEAPAAEPPAAESPAAAASRLIAPAGTPEAPAEDPPAAAASRLIAPAVAPQASGDVESAVPHAAVPREETRATRTAPATDATQTPRRDDRARSQDRPAANRPAPPPQGRPSSLTEDLRAPPPVTAAAGQLVAPSISVPPASAERPQAPDIEITIGQVEVRAPAPPAAAARRAGPARPRAISLADYLTKRDGGSR